MTLNQHFRTQDIIVKNNEYKLSDWFKEKTQGVDVICPNNDVGLGLMIP